MYFIVCCRYVVCFVLYVHVCACTCGYMCVYVGVRTVRVYVCVRACVRAWPICILCRWEGSTGKKFHSYQYFPFHAGPRCGISMRTCTHALTTHRVCLGQQMALLEAKTMIVGILQKFEMSLADPGTHACTHTHAHTYTRRRTRTHTHTCTRRTAQTCVHSYCIHTYMHASRRPWYTQSVCTSNTRHNVTHVYTHSRLSTDAKTSNRFDISRGTKLCRATCRLCACVCVCVQCVCVFTCACACVCHCV